MSHQLCGFEAYAVVILVDAYRHICAWQTSRLWSASVTPPGHPRQVSLLCPWAAEAAGRQVSDDTLAMLHRSREAVTLITALAVQSGTPRLGCAPHSKRGLLRKETSAHSGPYTSPIARLQGVYRRLKCATAWVARCHGAA